MDKYDMERATERLYAASESHYVISMAYSAAVTRRDIDVPRLARMYLASGRRWDRAMELHSLARKEFWS